MSQTIQDNISLKAMSDALVVFLSALPAAELEQSMRHILLILERRVWGVKNPVESLYLGNDSIFSRVMRLFIVRPARLLEALKFVFGPFRIADPVLRTNPLPGSVTFVGAARTSDLATSKGERFVYLFPTFILVLNNNRRRSRRVSRAARAC